MGHVHANIGLMQQFANANWEIICPETGNSIFDYMTMCAFQNIQQDILL